MSLTGHIREKRFAVPKDDRINARQVNSKGQVRKQGFHSISGGLFNAPVQIYERVDPFPGAASRLKDYIWNSLMLDVTTDPTAPTEFADPYAAENECRHGNLAVDRVQRCGCFTGPERGTRPA